MRDKAYNELKGKSTISVEKAKRIIDNICDDFELKLKKCSQNNTLAMELSESILQELKSERAIKEYIIKECLNPIKKELRELKESNK